MGTRTRGNPGLPARLRLLEQLLTIPVTAGKGWATGALANGVDSWLAHELRRAGFTPDEVWPRASRPRILPRDIALLLEKLPRQLSDEVRAKVMAKPVVAPTDAKILAAPTKNRST